MSNQFGFTCPKCRRADQIDIAATVWVRLTEDGTNADESADGSHEWGDSSPACCKACGFIDTVSNLTDEGGQP